jgi:dTDP-4-dehydrorhamnose 3,5-epimerase
MSPHNQMTPEETAILPAGVRLIALTTHSDRRGDLTEIFRNEWCDSPLPVQWLVSRTGPNILRGVHVHMRNWDYVCVIAGEVTVGLHDLRTKRSAILHLSAERLQVLVIPPGVAHGFYSPAPSTLLLGASTYYDPSDHPACRWDSPELGLDWPCSAPELSANDRDASSYSDFMAALRIDAECALS